jgi:hypothetical protein
MSEKPRIEINATTGRDTYTFLLCANNNSSIIKNKGEGQQIILVNASFLEVAAEVSKLGISFGDSSLIEKTAAMLLEEGDQAVLRNIKLAFSALIAAKRAAIDLKISHNTVRVIREAEGQTYDALTAVQKALESRRSG